MKKNNHVNPDMSLSKQQRIKIELILKKKRKILD
jgi:hypothetical protein